MTTTKNNKSASASATTTKAQNLLANGQYKITIGTKTTTGKNVFDCRVQTANGTFTGTLSNTKPTTHLKYTDNNGNKYDILIPTDITINGKTQTSKFLIAEEFAKFMESNKNKTFEIDKTITAKAKAKKLDLHTIPEFADKMKKIDALQKQIDEIMQEIKSSDVYKQLTQTEKQKQAQINLIDKVKMLIASGSIKLTDLQWVTTTKYNKIQHGTK